MSTLARLNPLRPVSARRVRRIEAAAMRIALTEAAIEAIRNEGIAAGRAERDAELTAAGILVPS
jgi:hypothetical protein